MITASTKSITNETSKKFGMKKNRLIPLFMILVFMVGTVKSQTVDLSPEILKFEPFIWLSEIPEDCPFEPSGEFDRIKFLGQKSGYRFDMPGFKPNEHYTREMKRYGILPQSFNLETDAIDVYETDQKYWESLWHIKHPKNK